MSNKKYELTKNDIDLIKLLKKVWNNPEFIINIIGNFENEEQKGKMVKWLQTHSDVNHIDVIGQMLEITMRGNLVESQFYDLNPDLKH